MDGVGDTIEVSAVVVELTLAMVLIFFLFKKLFLFGFGVF